MSAVVDDEVTIEVVADLAALHGATIEQWRSLEWRLDNLYWIADKGGNTVRFRLNPQQRRLVRRLWFRNLVLKARQLGISTLMQLIELDQAWTNINFNGVVIADTLPNAGKLFGKVEFAYDHLPPLLRQAYPLASKTKGAGLTIMHEDKNGVPQPSTISVSVSSRGGTVHLLHVSELGKMGLKFPQRAEEIRTGAFQSVPQDGVIVVESTAEGAFGLFYELCEPAIKRLEAGKPETALDWRLHFFPWFESQDYRLSDADAALVEIPGELTKYFAKIEAELRVKIDRNQRAWYAKTQETLRRKMKREYPSCIAAGVPVIGPQGIAPIEKVAVDGEVVTAHRKTGHKAIYRLHTDLGYTLDATADHLIKTPSGFVRLDHLKAGDEVCIGAALPSRGSQQCVAFRPLPMVASSVSIDSSMAEFVGLFMGDGSYSCETLSIACDAMDEDTIQRAACLISRFVGKPSRRVVGNKKGGVELRVGSKPLSDAFDAMGMLRRNAGGSIKRRVCVPDFIKTSQDEEVAAFLRGLFEADGFAQRDGTGIKLFSKHVDFARDVQLLLLRLGITCRRRSITKASGSGRLYEGQEISLRTSEAQRFAETIGFISARKQKRALSLVDAAPGHMAKRLPIATTAKVESINPAGHADVYDISTCSGEFSAGGIVVHNCPKEAFEQAVEGAIYGDQMTRLREQGRLGRVPLDPNYPVNTFWDFGVGVDRTGGGDTHSIWFHQQVGLQHRWFFYRSGHGKGLRYWWIEVCEAHRERHGYQWRHHYLPHDADTEILGEVVTTKHRILESLGMRNIVVVPRVATIQQGIEITRAALEGNHWFDDHTPDEDAGEDMGCGKGLKCLDGYQFEWDDKRGVWHQHPLHNWASHGADAWRQFAQGYRPNLEPDDDDRRRRRGSRGNWRTA